MDEFSQQLEQVATDTDFSGVVSITRGETAVFQKAYGWRDVKNELPNQIDTRFGIASGTKLLTALGIGVLIDDGVLALESEVGEINGRYAGFIDPAATIRQLLSHTSGIFDYYDEELIEDFDNYFVEIPWYRLETPRDYWPLFEGQPMKFAPGERYAYSNGGYVFLGILIEELSGQLYRDFLAQRVLEPAGMLDSGFFPLNNLPANTANGYVRDRATTNIFNIPIRGGGDGGLFTTAADVARLWSALMTGNIISPSLLTSFLQTQHKFNTARGYGCGLYKWLDDSIYFVVGSDAGVGFYSRYMVEEQIVATVLSNITDGEDEMVEAMVNYLSPE